MKKFFWIGLVFLLILAVIVGSWFFEKGKIDILNPLGKAREIVKKKEEYEVMGFLPTWMIGKTMEYKDEINKLVFLGIEVDQNGKLVWDFQAKKIHSEEYKKLRDSIKKSGGKNILGIKLFKDEDLDKLVENERAIDNLISEISFIKKEKGFNGINVDFEYQGDPTKVLEDDFLAFLKKLKQSGLGEISLDVFANTIIKGSKERLVSLMDNLDELVIMAYDFHRPGVDFAGAVAPIKSGVGERNILEIMDKINEFGLERKKIIMAYPLYGYEWKTYTDEYGSAIKRGWYQMASWKRVNELLNGDAKNLKINWSDVSMSPWMSFENGGQIHQIYYEDLKSVSAKIDLVKQIGLKGFGFWALGYEGEDKNLWKVVNSF